jgi:two-component system response regulator ResD
MGHSIYLADDEKSIRELLHSFLASDGYTVRSFESGDALLEAFRQEPAELVILDIMMPGTDGLTVCRELRAVSDIPIILLTAKDSELDYVMGISQGSDDYLTKPFRPTILLMKVKALLRRVEIDRGKTAVAEDELRYGDLRYSATENAVLCGNTPVALTQTELRLLSYMLKQPEKAYSREELLNAVWGFDSEVETRVTDETLRRIRKKLLQAGSTVSVSTIWGFGYKLKEAERT